MTLLIFHASAYNTRMHSRKGYVVTPNAPVIRRSTFNSRLKQAILIWISVLVLLTLVVTAGSFTMHDRIVIYLGYLGVSVALGIVLFIVSPPKKRPAARRLIVFLLGLLLFLTTVFSGRGNMQIEGLFFALFISLTHPSVIHFAIAKIVGPTVFGRVWCGWACWFASVFDQLPYRRSRGRLRGHWGWLRSAHLLFSLALVLFFWFGYGYSGASGETGLWWFLVGVSLYLCSGILMAIVLKDNRAFCKYACPNAILAKTPSRVAALKVSGNAEKCNECQACVILCPMDINVPQYILNGQRVLSSECTLCMTCINVCPRDALSLSLKADIGGEEHLRQRKPQTHVDMVRRMKLRRLLFPFRRPIDYL